MCSQVEAARGRQLGLRVPWHALVLVRPPRVYSCSNTRSFGPCGQRKGGSHENEQESFSSTRQAKSVSSFACHYDVGDRNQCGGGCPVDLNLGTICVWVSWGGGQSPKATVLVSAADPPMEVASV